MALSPTRKRLLIWGMVLALPVLLVAGCVAAIDAMMGEAEPMLVRADAFPAPAGSWTATREVVDNGLGFG